MIGRVRLMPHIINICILIKNETKLIDVIRILERSNMDEKLRMMIQEGFGICESLEEVCVLYKDLSLEIEKQMKFMISQLSNQN